MAEGRVLAVQLLALQDLLHLFGAAEVALEPYPFPASITTLDAFTAGTPVLAHGSALVRRGVAALSAGLYRRMGSDLLERHCIASEEAGVSVGEHGVDVFLVKVLHSNF